jgi:hypothetical protein
VVFTSSLPARRLTGGGGGFGGGGVGVITVSSGTMQMGANSVSFASGGGQVMVSNGSGAAPQFVDNGDGTMTVTLPDGTTHTFAKAQQVGTVNNNGDGTMTITNPDGSTRIMSTSGNSNMVFKTSP